MLGPHDRLCVLADSLPGVIRWRFCDYEQLLMKQLRLLTPPVRLVWPPRGDTVAAAFELQRGRVKRSVSSSLTEE
jgi:hypothetical protein